MATRIFFKTFFLPLSPPLESWVRRVLGVLQAVLACALGVFAIRLLLELRREYRTPLPPAGGISDAGGMAFAVVSYVLIPAIVLLGFGAVSVWRKRSVRWWIPLTIIVGLTGVVRFWR